MKAECPDCNRPVTPGKEKCKCGYVFQSIVDVPTTCHLCPNPIYRRVMRADKTWYGICREHTPKCFVEWRDRAVDDQVKMNARSKA